MILLFFIMRCTPIIRELIVATRYRCPLHRLPASRLLLPRSGLERSDFVRWHLSDVKPDSGMSAVGGRAEVVIASPDFRV